jgi:hypothetical protein
MLQKCITHFVSIGKVQQPGGFMAIWRIRTRDYLNSVPFVFMAAIALLAYPIASAQSPADQSSGDPAVRNSGTGNSSISTVHTDSTPILDNPTLSKSVWSGSNENFAAPAALFPDPPEPPAADGRDKYHVTPAATVYQTPFSRLAIGADVNPLGIGIKTAILLDHYYDARFMGNFFGYNSGRFEIEGFNVNADFHLASAQASLDYYPFGSIWRISPGLLFLNGNQISATSNIVSGTSFSLNNQTFFSASPNAATGATPLSGTGVLGFHTHDPAFTITGGFGKFIPRSNRHWSFPSEFGVAFTGAPSVIVNMSGWVCLDYYQTQCSNLGNPTTPVAIEFNSALQTQLAKWRHDLSAVKVYPLFSYSVVYSFNIRH